MNPNHRGTAELKRVCIQFLHTAMDLLPGGGDYGADYIRYVKEVREQLGVWNGSYPTPQRLIHLGNVASGLLVTTPKLYSVEQHVLEAVKSMIREVAAGWSATAAAEYINNLHDCLIEIATPRTKWPEPRVANFQARRHVARLEVMEASRAVVEIIGTPVQHVMGTGAKPQKQRTLAWTSRDLPGISIDGRAVA